MEKSRAYHSFSLGIKGSNKIGNLILLESNPRIERMRRIVLKNASSGVINQDQPSFTAHVSQAQSSNDIGSNGLNLMRFAPVDVRAASDAGSVEDVSGLHGGDVGLKRRAVLKAAGAINEIDSLLLTEIAK